MEMTLRFFLNSFGLSLSVVLFVLFNALMVANYREQEGKLSALAGLGSIIMGMNIIFLIVSLVEYF